MKKLLLIIFALLTTIFNIFSDENFIKFKPTEIVSIIQINKPNGFITQKTQAFDYYYYIIGVLEDNSKCAILIKSYTNNLEKSYGSNAIIINNEIYDKKYSKYDLEKKLKFALFSTWYEITLLDNEIEKKDFYNIDTSVKDISNKLYEKYKIKYILDINNRSKFVFKIIEPIIYDKLLFSELKIPRSSGKCII